MKLLAFNYEINILISFPSYLAMTKNERSHHSFADVKTKIFRVDNGFNMAK